MYEYGGKRSAIREIFEYGHIKKAQIGERNVFDFSLGNPCTPPPSAVTEKLMELVTEKDPVRIHGYTSASGIIGARTAIADNLTNIYGTAFSADNILMTCGAAAALTSSIKAITNKGDEVIVIAPYFPEYKVFIDSAGAKTVEVPARKSDMGIDTEAISRAIGKKTSAVIINSPNNPTGVIYDQDDLIELSAIIKDKEKKYRHPIYLISDEPYREIVYDKSVPSMPKIFDNLIICYSFSKSMTLPGERIGYVAVSPKSTDADKVITAVSGAARSMGYVCAPSMFQRMVAECINEKPNIDFYRINRDILLKSLTEYGYECICPDGAFYLFIKSPTGDAIEFSEAAKKYNLLIVPSDSFGIKGYLRISYCVTKDTVQNSLPAFKKLIEEYK